jgi:signal peptidase II
MLDLRTPKGRTFWSALAAVLAFDVVTKALAVANLRMYLPREVIGEVFRLTLVYNPGAAFGSHFGEHSRIIFSLLSLVVLVVLARLYRETRPDQRLQSLGLGLVVGGAIGNLIDRVRSPLGVVDFIDVGVGDVRFWTFNVADAGVSVGAVLLAWVLSREPAPEGEAERAEGAAA